MGRDDNIGDQLPLPGFALDIVQDCRAALKDELGEVRKRGDRFAVRHGRVLHRGSSTTYFVFEAALPRHLTVGTRGVLSFDNSDALVAINVELVAVADNTVVLVSESPKATVVPSSALTGTVELSSAWLIEALDARLHAFELGGGDDVLLEELLSPDYGDIELASGSKPETERSFDIDHDAQAIQARAAQSALEPGLRFVWGPPGTGKTTVLAETVRLAVAQGRRVLVLGHSNVAVDVAMERIAEVLDDELLSNGRVLRVGYPALESVATNEALTPAKVASRQHPGLADRLDAVDSELRDLVSAAKDDSTDGSVLGAKIASLRDERDDIARQLKKAGAALIDKAQVVGTTIAKATTSDQIWKWSKDLVIVDEASMVGMPTVLALVLRGADTLSFFGDFRQLPPVAVSQSKRATAWMGRDVFEFAGVREAQEAGHPDARTAVLNVQFRMSEGVCAVVNDLAYDGLLRTHPTARNRGIRLADVPPFGDDEVVIVDVSELHTRAAVEAAPDRFSRCNLGSAAVSVIVGAEMAASELSVGLLSPYREQAALMAGLSAGADRIEAATAHRFQGGERDVVVVDLVDAFPLDAASKLTGTDPELALRLLNVAASRARGKLFVVADLDFLHDRHPLNSPALRLVHAATKSGAALVSATQLFEAMRAATTEAPEPITHRPLSLDSFTEAMTLSRAEQAPAIELNLPGGELWSDEFVDSLRSLVAASPAPPLVRCTTACAALIDDLDVEISLVTCGLTPYLSTDRTFTIAAGSGALTFPTSSALPIVHRFFGVD